MAESRKIQVKDGTGSVPTWDKIRRGFRIFVVLTILGLVYVLYRSSFADSVEHLRRFGWPWLLLALSMAVFDWFAAGLRIWIFAARLQPGIRPISCVRAALANIFLGGVTPSQTGGGPGQIYVLYKEGMPVFDAMVVSFLGAFLGTAIVLPVCGLIFTLFFDPVAVDFRLQYLVKGAIVTFGFILLVAALGLVNPRLLQNGLRRLVGLIPPLYRRLEDSGKMQVMTGIIERYHHMMLFFLRRAKLVFIAGIVLTGVIYFNKFMIAWVVLRGLGIDADFWEVIYSQMVLFLIFYFAPSPGAAGVAEVSTAEVMKGIITPGYGGAFVLLWRLFTLFIGLAVGALVTIRVIYADRATAGESVVDYRSD
jgi:glycosyltransferase 2 family protein